ncbi:hypothetical protein RJT34_19431 [Clitoria ternatea]|uniref:CW-type domain-containing protein n=1 Tax=Clitoria ternatea TaxID=43366 RepID=A0AAN9IR98_CLITE
MISAGGRDAIKGLGLGLGLGLGAGRREMVESDLEEGEACSFQNHEDYDTTVDPDVALSYIDEKIQDVLGHFQKDFEGGVSAENLGAKFGGYGSFLPTYQRSPVWSHPKTPQKFHSQNTPRSPNNLQLEGGQGDIVQCSTGTQSLRLGHGSATSSRMAANKGLSLDDGTNQEKCMTTTIAEAFTSKHEALNRKATGTSDQKTLRFRIKMGPENLSTRKNAAIYSGLGLDVSPSSSLDDSPSESEGISRGPQDAPFESPTIILQIITSLPKLLSPLPDDTIELAEKRTRTRDSILGPVHMDDSESSDMLQNESNIIKGDRKLSGGRKVKSLEGHESLMEVKGCTKKNTRNDVGMLSRKEQSADALNMEELVSKTMKLPLLSYSLNDDLVKAVDGPCDSLKEANKGIVKEKAFSDQGQKEQLELTSAEVNGFAERTKGSSGRKVVGDNVSLDDCVVKDNPHGDKNCHSNIAESNVSKFRSASNTEEPSKKANQRTSLCEQDSQTLPVVTECPFPGGKKKSKGSHGTMVMEKEKENLKVGSTLVPKTKRSSEDSSASKNETEDVRAPKGLGKVRDTYRDFFGELEDEEDRIDSLDTHCEENLKESEVVDRSAPTTSCGTKERSGGKKVDKPSTAEIYPKITANVRSTTNGNGTDAENGKGIPVMMPPMEDNWVQCDRCHKWRLLPVGTNPDNLPEKWLCSMLNWLPDMNRCSFSEDETTKALVALYQGPPLDGQSNLQHVSGNVMVGGTLATFQHSDKYQLSNDLHAVPGGKKKVAKEMSNSKDGPSHSSHSIKKNLPSAVKSRSLNEVNRSPVVSEPDVSVEKHKIKPRILEHDSDRGDIKNMKVKSRRDPNQDCSRPSKKVKADKVHSTNEEWIPEQSGTTRRVGHSSNGTFPTSSAGKDRHRQKDHSSRDSKSGKDRLPVSAEHTKDRGQGSLDEGSLDLGNCDSIGSGKKRKLKGYQDALTHSTENPHLQESKNFGQEVNDSRKEKKARTSKSEGKESSASKGSGRTDKKVSLTKNHKFRKNPEISLSQRSLDGMDGLKRDLGPAQASVAATSSSSKVSGSHKTKASFPEVKGSPVESVSSSPLRILNTDKFANKGNIVKDDSHDVTAVDSPRRCSDREDDGGSDRSGTARKDKSFTMAHRSDFQNKDVNHMSNTKPKAQTTSHCINGGVDTVAQDGMDPATEQTKHPAEDRTDVYYANTSHPKKNGIESGLEDNNGSCKSDSHAEKFKNTSSPRQLKDQSPLHEAKRKDGKIKLQEKSVVNPDQSDNIRAGKKDYIGKNESRKKENHLNWGHDSQEVSVAPGKLEAAPIQNQLPDCDTERSSKRSLSERNDQEVHGKGKSLSLLPSEGSQIETLSRCPRPVGFHRGNGETEVDPSKADDLSKLQKKQVKKTDLQNGIQQIGSRNPILNGHKSKELDAPSPVRRDSYTHAANNAVKEAKDLKHLADRVKNSGSSLESTSLYFQAALKFLYGAALLESGNNDNAKHSEMIQSKQVYSSTAKLCEFCAHEYEKSKDMASAALAYKCMEVAYMRVVYFSHPSANKDRHELQTTLQMIPLGESPSSSASDVDNVNNSTAADKFALSKSINSPQVAGNHVIAARNRPNLARLLNFAQDMNFAMEASRKSRNAFVAANSSPGKYAADGISSIKKALDFSFHDVEGLLHLVRVALDAINR